MSKNLKKQWRVQVKRKGKWVNRGLYETRANAREKVYELRELDGIESGDPDSPYGFGNTRYLPYVKGQK